LKRIGSGVFRRQKKNRLIYQENGLIIHLGYEAHGHDTKRRLYLFARRAS
jgi:hypothetical protein